MDHRLGEPGKGFKLMLATLATFRVSVAGAAVGLAQAALEEALRHTTAREQFGVPLARLGPVPAKLAESWVEIEMARAMSYRAAAAAARDPLTALHLSSMAKVGATEVGRPAHRRPCVQVMGRFGLVRGSKIERLYREARPMRIYEGSTEVILDSLAKKLVKDRARAGDEGRPMIVDCHMHVWPDHIADAMQSQRPSGMALRYDGKVSGLLRTMDEAGIDLGLALGVGIKASVVARTNEFIGRCLGPAGPRSAPSTRTAGRGEPAAPQGQRDRRRQAAPAVPGPVAGRPAGARPPRALAAEGMPVITHAGAGGGRGRQRARDAGGAAPRSSTRCPTSR